MNKLSDKELDFLFSPAAIRDRAGKLFEFTRAGRGNFVYHAERLPGVVDYVIEVIRKNYPSLEIPFHSRWGHFRAGGVNRVAELDSRLQAFDPLARARAKLDLVIPSVLLDAGAGAAWGFEDGGKRYGRSEGLGIASFRMFLDGAFSGDGKSLRADREGLARFSAGLLEKGFQVSAANPLVGVEGRVRLLNNLASALENREIFKDGRPGNIIDYLVTRYGRDIPAPGILRAVIDGLGPIWPGRLSAGGVNLGDVWQHTGLASPGSFDALVPFHKLSQWMTYSLIEPILEAGFTVNRVDKLTGLAEYRNGGLMLDSGLISLADPAAADQAWEPGSELIIEWRALTVHLLDLIGEAVQAKLGFTPAEMPLAKVLEGGTWWAGRFLAAEKRAGGDPPLKIQSDGTVF